MRRMVSPSPAVVVQGVSKSFAMPHEQVHTLKERALHPFRRSGSDVLQVLNDVSFEVQPGEFFGIVGRNGSGKSTLLKCLAGIYSTNAGGIYINGRLSTFIELGVGFNPDLAARDNSLLNAVMLGLTRREAEARYERIIEFAELERFQDLKIKNYSSGMLVRLAFSVMIQVDADVLLIDEVLAVGDASFQQKCYDEFNRLRDERRTILFVTHEMAAVARFCDRALLLERGDVKMIDEPDRVAAEYFEVNFGRGGTPEPTADPDEPVHYGDGKAEIASAWFEDGAGNPVDTLAQGAPCAFVIVIRFVEDMVDPSFAMLLETAEHQPVFGTSTTWTEERTGTFRAGELVGFRVAFENTLAPGRYYVTPSVARRGGGEDVHVRVLRMASVVVTGTRDSGGVVNIPHDIRIERQASVAQ
jgi:ABC-type polysaccharide/polyol phosphate transport system ATPase subunit